jgi:catechol 2,3-dioxygenase-like lactoylglutathione lyase family enzyme
MPNRSGGRSAPVISSKAKRTICFFLGMSALLSVALLSGVQPASPAARKRPRILGIASVTILSTNLPVANGFYRRVILQNTVCDLCERPPIRIFAFATGQKVEVVEAPAETSNFLSEVSFLTEDLGALRKYLEASAIKIERETAAPGSPSRRVVTRDPEGHEISFVESKWMESVGDLSVDPNAPADFRKIIHAGFVVHDRAAEDKFYKDILGFHVYWHGGMQEGEDNWVDMQVPDGTDWIEYMLKVPENASHKTLGVMNHIALGVPDIHKAQEQLVKNGWKGGEEPKIGRDGKWQLNLYDPDETRVELMEFTPTKEPCCSPYTGPHPHP